MSPKWLHASVNDTLHDAPASRDTSLTDSRTALDEGTARKRPANPVDRLVTSNSPRRTVPLEEMTPRSTSVVETASTHAPTTAEKRTVLSPTITCVCAASPAAGVAATGLVAAAGGNAAVPANGDRAAAAAGGDPSLACRGGHPVQLLPIHVELEPPHQRPRRPTAELRLWQPRRNADGQANPPPRGQDDRVGNHRRRRRVCLVHNALVHVHLGGQVGPRPQDEPHVGAGFHLHHPPEGKTHAPIHVADAQVERRPLPEADEGDERAVGRHRLHRHLHRGRPRVGGRGGAARGSDAPGGGLAPDGSTQTTKRRRWRPGASAQIDSCTVVELWGATRELHGETIASINRRAAAAAAADRPPPPRWESTDTSASPEVRALAWRASGASSWAAIAGGTADAAATAAGSSEAAPHPHPPRCAPTSRRSTSR
eukprot:TRINITY_DN4272_c0_g1_i1.p1 TRINITY_DN4272_c0_g1~~TRINITY_DN4272_c0_g1_i1.p1  ORF type:complete len:427 (+),score=63.26 TRINITY_DN4272_c0_g1_i1:769-2049(+)